MALNEIKIGIAALLLSFDLALAPGFDPVGFEGTITDRFLYGFQRPLDVVLRKRADGPIFD